LVSLLFTVILIRDFCVVSSSDTSGKQWKASECLEVHKITSSIQDSSKNTPNSLRALHGHFSFICWDRVMRKYLIRLFNVFYFCLQGYSQHHVTSQFSVDDCKQWFESYWFRVQQLFYWSRSLVHSKQGGKKPL